MEIKSNVELQRELAISLVNILMEGIKKENRVSNLQSFLMGYSVWALPIRNQRGELENDYNSVLQGIYEYYLQHPTDKIDKLTEESLIEIFKNCSKISYVQNAARIVQYQLNNEQQKTAPFKIDCIKVLKEYQENLNRNKEKYQASTKYQTFGYIDEEINRIASRKH